MPATRWSPSSADTSVGRKALGYVCAIAFAWLTANLSLRFQTLHGTPLALNFAAVAGITTFFGLGPGIASVLFTAVIFYYRVLLPESPSALAPGAVIRTAVILTVGFLIALLSERQRTIRIKLRSALDSLSEHADTLAQAQQGSRSAAWVYHVKDRSIRWAHGGADLMGRPNSDVTQLDSLMELVHPQDRPRIREAALATRESGTPFHAEFRVSLPNGDTRWLEVRGTASPSDSQWRGVVLDVTERKHAGIALLRSEKLAAIGRLSATVAHEINNPLEAVTNLLYLASSDAHLCAETRGYLDAADQELKRLASIARHTLTFARTRPAGGKTDVGPVAENVVAMFQTQCNSRGGSVRLISTDDLQVDVPSDELRQILTNLLSNACDALAEAQGIVEVDLFAHEGTVTIIVRDTGVGIPAENLERIFDPFFTTKDDFGTGIGLWVTKELVENNRGSITADSSDRQAPFKTSFRVEFPRSKNSG